MLKTPITKKFKMAMYKKGTGKEIHKLFTINTVW
jgi:hypothetical protein